MTSEGKAKTLHFKRSHFVTHLPVSYRYSPSHAWIAPHDEETWRVGLTKFATRMLGEIVDLGFEPAPGTPVKQGEVIGWIEGFKAISDLFCIVQGEFGGANPMLKEKVDLISRDPYGRGWLYLARGQPELHCLDVYGYRDILDQTIDRLLAKQRIEENK